MPSDGIDWDELARVMREEHHEKALVCLANPDGTSTYLGAPSRLAYIRARGMKTIAVYLVRDDGSPDFLVRLEVLRQKVKEIDAERGWT
jgi:hypothetical protein